MGSRSDKLFQKRKLKNQKHYKRQKPSVPERKRVLIVCEGEKTEPLYLRALVSHLGLTTAEVEVCGKCGSAPTSVVQHGENKFDADPDFDLIFFVFDRDSHTDYDKALNQIQGFQTKNKFKGKVVKAITSIPCFEIWFILHFEAYATFCDAGGGKSPCGDLISILKSKDGFTTYEKGNKNYFDILQGRLHQARKNAVQTLSQSISSGDKMHHGNPTTLMHELIDELEQVSADYKA